MPNVTWQPAPATKNAVDDFGMVNACVFDELNRAGRPNRFGNGDQ